jgi:hypothetical protein
VDYRRGSVTVHSNNTFGTLGYVTDVGGNEIGCGHRRPVGPGTG